MVFTPDADFNGAASFEYTVSDGNTASTASVAVTVNPVNDAPVAGDDSLSAEKNTPITISAADLLVNDADVDGDALAIAGIGGALNASVALDANGDIQFTPRSEFRRRGEFPIHADRRQRRHGDGDRVRRRPFPGSRWSVAPARTS